MEEIDFFEEGPLERMVSGALRDTITAHGAIDHKQVGSASKRFVCALRARIRGVSTNKKLLCQAHEEVIKELRKEIEELKKLKERANSQERRWRKLLQKHNIALSEPLDTTTTGDKDGDMSRNLGTVEGID